MASGSDRESSASNERQVAAEAMGREESRSSTQEISVDERARRRAAIDAILALRYSGRIKPVTLEEVLAWRHEGHRC